LCHYNTCRCFTANKSLKGGGGGSLEAAPIGEGMVVGPKLPASVALARVRLDGQLLKHDIIGDGNCLFRTVAAVVLGDEDKHLVVRAAASSVFETVNKGKFEEGNDLLLPDLRRFFERLNRLGEYKRLIAREGRGYVTQKHDFVEYLSTAGAGWANFKCYELLAMAYPTTRFRYWMPGVKQYPDSLVLYCDLLHQPETISSSSSSSSGSGIDVVDILWEVRIGHFSLLSVPEDEVVCLRHAKKERRAMYRAKGGMDGREHESLSSD
jgi:hypothetical protein